MPGEIMVRPITVSVIPRPRAIATALSTVYCAPNDTRASPANIDPSSCQSGGAGSLTAYLRLYFFNERVWRSRAQRLSCCVVEKDREEQQQYDSIAAPPVADSHVIQNPIAPQDQHGQHGDGRNGCPRLCLTQVVILSLQWTFY